MEQQVRSMSNNEGEKKASKKAYMSFFFTLGHSIRPADPTWHRDTEHIERAFPCLQWKHSLAYNAFLNSLSTLILCRPKYPLGIDQITIVLLTISTQFSMQFRCSLIFHYKSHESKLKLNVNKHFSSSNLLLSR